MPKGINAKGKGEDSTSTVRDRQGEKKGLSAGKGKDQSAHSARETLSMRAGEGKSGELLAPRSGVLSSCLSKAKATSFLHWKREKVLTIASQGRGRPRTERWLKQRSFLYREKEIEEASIELRRGPAKCRQFP